MNSAPPLTVAALREKLESVSMTLTKACATDVKTTRTAPPDPAALFPAKTELSMVSCCDASTRPPSNASPPPPRPAEQPLTDTPVSESDMADVGATEAA